MILHLGRSPKISSPETNATEHVFVKDELWVFKYVAVCESCVKASYLDKTLENKQV